MIRVGIVGLGFMGWIHWLAYQKLRGVKVAAICDSKPKRLKGDWRGLRGNFGPPGEKVDLHGAAGYLDWHDLIRDPAIDLVDITLPTALHAEVAIATLAAGKHVLCEKPMALSAKDCRRMIRAAKKSDRLLMVAHVLPFFPEYAWALQAIRSEKYGPLLSVWLKRCISEPTWMTNYWSATHIGGPMFDLHIHDAHFLRLALGMPKSARATGKTRGPVPEWWRWRFFYPRQELVHHEYDLDVNGESGVLDGCEWTFNHGFTISFERRCLKFDFAVIAGRGHYIEVPQEGDDSQQWRKVKLPFREPVDVFAAELREAIRCVRKGESSETLSPEIALDAIRICEAESKSIARGRKVRI